MPGAFVYHLHSYNAYNLRSATKNWVGPLLARGTTITMGSVDEPFLSGTPEVAIFAARLIFFGFSFGEAACASQSVLSWQTTVVGDPLYRPFGKPAQQLQDELAARNSPLIEWSYLRLINLNLAKGIPVSELATYLERLDLTKHSAVLAEKLADLYAAQGKPSSAVEWSERALKLNPSPQQRVRLRLVLAERLTALKREADALDDLDKLLQENPDYPARLELYRKLLGLAQKLGKKDLAANYEEHIRQLSPAPK
jgi:tetratricopeptide (TPR) repeat protein